MKVIGKRVCFEFVAKCTQMYPLLSTPGVQLNLGNALSKSVQCTPPHQTFELGASSGDSFHWPHQLHWWSRMSVSALWLMLVVLLAVGGCGAPQVSAAGLIVVMDVLLWRGTQNLLWSTGHCLLECPCQHTALGLDHKQGRAGLVLHFCLFPPSHTHILALIHQNVRP